MKRLFWLRGILLVVGAFFGGMVTQKKYGIGNLLDMLVPNRAEERVAEVIPPSQAGKLDIFILAGQSNMEGHGVLEEYTLAPPADSVFVFNKEYVWQRGKEPVNDEVGPSIAFATELLKCNNQHSIGLVNVAWGGTNIAQWAKSSGDKSLYQRMLKRALAASTQGQIKALLFMQGENDAEGDSTDHYTDWDVQFGKFVAAVRQDLHNDTLPVVFGQIGKGNKVRWLQVKACQLRLKLPHVAMIKTDDLAYQDTGVHYTTKAYIELGKRFAQGYINLEKAHTLK